MHSGLLTKRFTLGLAACLLTVGCGGDPESGFGFERSAIINGDPADTEDHVVQIVGRLSDISSVTCSGTLIAPNVVVTALHCVTYRDDPNGTFNCKPDGSIEPIDPNGGILGLPVAGEDVSIYTGQAGTELAAVGVKVFGSGATQICRGDLAAVVIDTDLPGSYPALRFSRPVTKGEDFISIGYGQTEDGFAMGRHRRDIRVLDVGDVGSTPGTGPTPPDTFVVGAGPCHGDSGGPAISQETGAITGVYSLTLSPNCSTITVKNTYTILSQFEDTIREALEFAGQEATIEEGSGGSGGTASTGGSGGTAGMGEGSGSRDDATCGCRTVGVRTHDAFGLGALVVALFATSRRARRNARG